ncbi:MAG: DUF1631 domain-containing protein [Pseudomonadales bacterium]
MVDSSNKVVPLGKHTGGKPGGQSARAQSVITQGNKADESHLFARIPAPFVAMKDKGKQGLQPLLQALFDNIDDALFELADRAEHNVEQNIYFESMREVRIKRRGMELGMGRELDESFRQLLATGAPPVLTDTLSADEISMDNLSLVADEELEELVAVDSMVVKAERQFNIPLKQLTTRLDTLIDGQAVTGKNNPFGPTVICQAFIVVCRELDLDIKAKLVLFKLFDRYVMGGLGSVYQLCNTVLVEGGILPKLEQRNHRRAKQTAQQATLSATLVAADAEQQQSTDVFADLQNLLHQWPQPHAQANNVQANNAQVNNGLGPVSSGLVAPGQAPQIPRDTLMQLLQAVQQSLLPQLEQQQQAALQGVAPVQLDIQQTLSRLLSAKMPSKPMSIGQVDDDAINLVAMLFQFILDDRNLASPMKALIARLQIPIIKVAMLDKSFFSKGGHPARKLLNDIANASLGWMAGPNLDRDPLYNQVSSVVTRLLNEFDGDTAIFHEILADFVAFIEMDKRRSGLIEQRTVNAEDGKAKSEIARNTVQTALNDRVAGRSLPKVVITLLEEAWSHVLFLICLKDGDDDKNWQDALQVVDDLLWSVEPMESTESRQRLLKMVPNLLKNLRAGLTKIGFNPFDMNQLFTDLETIHLTQLNELNTVKLDIPAPALKAKQTKVIEKTLDQLLEDRSGSDVTLEQLDAELDQQLAEFDALGCLVAQAADDEAAVLEKPPVASDAMAATDNNLVRRLVEKLKVSGTTAELEESAATALQDADPCLQQVDALAMGNWVELHQDDGKKFRCRLAAIIRSTGKYIFVNRSGMKVSEYNRLTLAHAIKQGSVSPLDEGLLFDRALEAVIGNLRNVKTSTA